MSVSGAACGAPGTRGLTRSGFNGLWLTPGSQWRRKYRGWPALAKLRYIDRIARRVRDLPPPRERGATDITVDEMDTTLADFYEGTTEEKKALLRTLTTMDDDAAVNAIEAELDKKGNQK